ncbi:MAG: hypothetical protein K9N23_08270 [Akkermansiaceae bacterium]|nr:hypothetical protein [Akkermansiaceae bacterium]
MTSPTLSPFPRTMPGSTLASAGPPPFWCRAPLPKADPVQSLRPPTPPGLPPWPALVDSGHREAHRFPAIFGNLPMPSPESPPAAAIPSPFSAVPPVPLDTPAHGTPHQPLLGRIPLMGSTIPPVRQPDFTDADLAEALSPVIRQAIQTTVIKLDADFSSQLEPLLRSTIRRALAEYNPTSRPFRPPGLLDRFFWRLLALFTSRTYEEIIFEKTNRFQVEEVFLLDRHSLAMISYASNDPARHSAPRRIEATAQRLARQARGPENQRVPAFALPERRIALTCEGEYGILVAITRGTPNELLLSDLDFSLRRIESRFRARFKEAHQPLLQELQPYLEDCLLIQAPAAA